MLHQREHRRFSVEEYLALAGQLGLGRWQRVFLVELDEARSREIILQVWGM